MPDATDDDAREERDRQEARARFIQNVGASASQPSTPQTPPAHVEPRIAGVDVTSGVVALNASAIRTVAERLRDDMRRNAVLRERFFDNPRQVLGAVGLNEEIQNELLQNDFNLGNTPFSQVRLQEWCVTTQCCCTNCCLTSWF
jgi:hypothetical protein